MSTTLTFGDATANLVHRAFDAGAGRAVLLLRHSARTFDPEIHDLLNPLTEEGRDFADDLGRALPQGLSLRGYASPPERCVDTAQCMLNGYAATGGQVARVRPVEAFGVFYALDQQRMWKGMQVAGGLVPYVDQWVDGHLPGDAMMPAALAASLIYRVLNGRLNSLQSQAAKVGSRSAVGHLDVCVTHDLTLHLLRACLLGHAANQAPVEFLDGLLLVEEASGDLVLRSQDGLERRVTDELRLT